MRTMLLPEDLPIVPHIVEAKGPQDSPGQQVYHYVITIIFLSSYLILYMNIYSYSYSSYY